MGFVEGLALTAVGIILLETLVLLFAPNQVVSLARMMARFKTVLMIAYTLIGLCLLYFLLENFSMVEIMATGVVVTIFYGVALVPYYDAIVEELETDLELGNLWLRLGPGLFIWLLLATAVLLDWSTAI